MATNSAGTLSALWSCSKKLSKKARSLMVGRRSRPARESFCRSPSAGTGAFECWSRSAGRAPPPSEPRLAAGMSMNSAAAVANFMCHELRSGGVSKNSAAAAAPCCPCPPGRSLPLPAVPAPDRWKRGRKAVHYGSTNSLENSFSSAAFWASMSSCNICCVWRQVEARSFRLEFWSESADRFLTPACRGTHGLQHVEGGEMGNRIFF